MSSIFPKKSDGRSVRNTSEDRESDLSDSWVTYNVNPDEDQNNGITEKEVERLLREAQRESGQSSIAGSSKSSKVGSSLPNTPCNSPQSTPDGSGQVSPKTVSSGGSFPQRTIPEMLSNNVETTGTDWVWDWSSTPGAQPPKKSQFKRPRTTPINMSIRKTGAMSSGYFSWEFLQVFIPSLILTNVVAFGIGVYLGKRLAVNKTS